MPDPNKALTKEEQLDILNAFFNRILGEGKEPKAGLEHLKALQPAALHPFDLQAF